MGKFRVGLQLYSVKQEMANDMENTIKAVADMGYDFVEFAGYFGRTAEQVREMLDKCGLECISVHQNPTLFWDEGQSAIEYIKTIGAKYSAIPHYDINEFRNNWSDTIKKFTSLGEDLRKNGIQLLYHNHDFEFEKADGEYIFDKLFKEVSDDLMLPQIDTCWVHYAGENPAEYVLKYKGKIDALHLKDFVCENLGAGPVYELIGKDGTAQKGKTREENGFMYKPLGRGIQDIPAILDAAEKAGVKYLIVEQDDSPEMPPLEAAKISRDYLKTLNV